MNKINEMANLVGMDFVDFIKADYELRGKGWVKINGKSIRIKKEIRDLMQGIRIGMNIVSKDTVELERENARLVEENESLTNLVNGATEEIVKLNQQLAELKASQKTEVVVTVEEPKKVSEAGQHHCKGYTDNFKPTFGEAQCKKCGATFTKMSWNSTKCPQCSKKRNKK